MLSAIVLEAWRHAPAEKRKRGFSVTSISPCAYETYLNFLKSKLPPPEENPEDILRLKDGWWQEKQMLEEDLPFAGFEISERQMEVHVGPSRTLGHIDGLIRIGNSRDLIDTKAVDYRRILGIKRHGLDHEPMVRCQLQLYMSSEELRQLDVKRGWVYLKHKDTCIPYDIMDEPDPDYVAPIIENAESVKAGWIPARQETKLCVHCYQKRLCWEQERGPDDETAVPLAVGPEELAKACDTWRLGKQQSTTGYALMNKAKIVFDQAVGDSAVILNDLKVQRIISHTMQWDKKKFLALYGPQALLEILNPGETFSLRVDDLRKSAKRRVANNDDGDGSPVAP
jgi:CRISPR/Cas system-associated exonuclease Cas4 (RecB family)